VAPIEFEGDHHVPKVDQSKGLVIASGCLPSHPTFSTDGRWLHAIADTGFPSSRIARLSIEKLVESPK
jgi:hypothetical protein